MVATGIEDARSQSYKLTREDICDLNRIAMTGVEDDAGRFRRYEVIVDDDADESNVYEPPPWKDVPHLIDEMCEYVNVNWAMTPVHLAAYLLWRLNWIHAFGEGNGRTARAVSYVVFCIKNGFKIPGIKTLPERIAEDRSDYYDALAAADEGNLEPMETLVGDLLTAELADFLDKAHNPTRQTKKVRRKPIARKRKKRRGE